MRHLRTLRCLLIAALVVLGCDSESPESSSEDSVETTSEVDVMTTEDGAAEADATTDAPEDAVEDGEEEEVAEDTGGGDAEVTAAVVPDFQLEDVNAGSETGGQLVSPRDYLGQVSAWYFTHAT